jgi:hemerythrin-like domain-containing protein
MEDHRRAKRAFREAEKMKEEEDEESLEQIVQQTCAELTVHATLEEELFYPALREGIKDTELLDEAEVEHGSAKALIAELEQMDSSDPKFAATFKVLGEYIKHHIKEEEGEMFGQLSRTGVQQQGLIDQSEESEQESAREDSSRRGRRRSKQDVAEEEIME